MPAKTCSLTTDMFYTCSGARALSEFLQEKKYQGAIVLIADAERTFTPKTGVVALHEEIIEVNRDLEGVDTRSVRIIRL